MKAPSGENAPGALFRALSLFSPSFFAAHPVFFICFCFMPAFSFLLFPFPFLPLLSEKLFVTAQNVNKIIKFTIPFIWYTKKDLLPGKGTGDGRKLHA